jgi:Glycosyl transferase family 11
MIGVKIQGRLGNQMFQYAFSFVTAKKLSSLFFMFFDDDSDLYVLPNYFELRIKERYLQRLGRIYFKLTSKFLTYKKVVQSGGDKLNTMELRNNTIYYGFFQSEFFFRSYSKKIKNLFTIKKEFRLKFDEKFGSTFRNKKTVVVHFRGGDYYNWSSDEFGGKNVTLPIQYYKNCFAMIENLETYKIIFVSDDIAFFQQNFQNLGDAVFLCDEEIMDFQLLLNADKLIISNSTFSWWGAYLNYYNAEVFAPKYWLGFKNKVEYPLSIIPSNFKQVDVGFSDGEMSD